MKCVNVETKMKTLVFAYTAHVHRTAQQRAGATVERDLLKKSFHSSSYFLLGITFLAVFCVFCRFNQIFTKHDVIFYMIGILQLLASIDS